MFEALEKGQALRDLIVELLRQGPSSISQLAKRLKEHSNVDLHRLALAGYLRALADLGVLEEREIPPAKVYALRPAPSPHSLYDAVAERIRELRLNDLEAAQLCVQVLHDLFHRPVFREELRRAGFHLEGGLKESSAEERQAARRLFAKSPLKLPFNDPAYVPASGEAAAGREQQARHILASVVRTEFRAANLAQTTRQATLGSVE